MVYDKSSLVSNPNQDLNVTKKSSLKEEISILLQLLASKNRENSLNPVVANSDENSITNKEDGSKLGIVTMRDVEKGI